MTLLRKEDQCVRGCGFFSRDTDELFRHEREEHVECTECGNAPDDEGVYPVSHKADCLRLLRNRAEESASTLVVEDQAGGGVMNTVSRPYRVGNHSPINVWYDPDGNYSTSQQVCMATSPAMAQYIVESLNLTAHDFRTIVTPVGPAQECNHCGAHEDEMPCHG